MPTRAARPPASATPTRDAKAPDPTAEWTALGPLDRWMLLFIVLRERPWCSTLLGAWEPLAELELVVVTTVRRPNGNVIPAVAYTPEGERLAMHAMTKRLVGTAEWQA